MIKSAKQTQKEYAERPFSFRNLYNTQFTIEEKLDISANPRSTKKEGVSKYNKPYSMEIVKVNVSDGVFQKDLEMTEGEWTILCAALPKGLVSLQGVTLKIGRDNTTFAYKVEYIGIAKQDTEGNLYNGPASQPAEAKPEMPKQLNDYAIMLCEAVKMDNTFGRKVDIQVLTKMADTIYPNRALDVIQAAKAGGYISDHGAEGYRGH